MKIFDYSQINKVYVLGDLHDNYAKLRHIIKYGLSKTTDTPAHPKYLERIARVEARRAAMRDNATEERNVYADTEEPRFTMANKLKFNQKISSDRGYNNSVIIVAGDCGIGFCSLQYYINTFKTFNETLAENNCNLLFVRGNHDDPSYFNDELINLSNIKTIPDYSIIKTETNNILCVGGATSIDRTWRIDQEVLINRYSKSKRKKIFWENEAPIYNEEALQEIIDNKINIDTIITHTCPSFAPPKSKETAIEWFKHDANLKHDIDNERQIMTNIYNFLKAHDNKLDAWFYGHFHNNANHVQETTLFRMLNLDLHILNVNETIISHKASMQNKNIIQDKLNGLKMPYKKLSIGEENFIRNATDMDIERLWHSAFPTLEYNDEETSIDTNDDEAPF